MIFSFLNPGMSIITLWLDAHEDGVAPKVILEACEESALKVVPLDVLKAYAVAGAH